MTTLESLIIDGLAQGPAKPADFLRGLDEAIDALIESGLAARAKSGSGEIALTPQEASAEPPSSRELDSAAPARV